MEINGFIQKTIEISVIIIIITSIAIPIISSVGLIPGETETNTTYENRMSLYTHELPQTILSYDAESSNYVLNGSVIEITAVSGTYTQILASENTTVSVSSNNPGTLYFSQAPDWSTSLSKYDLVESGPIDLSQYTKDSKTNFIIDDEGSYLWCYKGSNAQNDIVTYVALDDTFYTVGTTGITVLQALQDAPAVIRDYSRYQATEADAYRYGVFDDIAHVYRITLHGTTSAGTNAIIAKVVASTEVDYLDKTERNLVDIIPIVMILGVVVAASTYFIINRRS